MVCENGVFTLINTCHNISLSGAGGGREVSVEVPDFGRRESDGQDPIGDTKSHCKDMDSMCVSTEASGENLEEGEGEGGATTMSQKKRRRNAYEVRSFPPKMHLVAKAVPTMKGHTAYLTFAVAPADAMLMPTVGEGEEEGIDTLSPTEEQSGASG